VKLEENKESELNESEKSVDLEDLVKDRLKTRILVNLEQLKNKNNTNIQPNEMKPTSTHIGQELMKV
jgi:hypothetical protein